MASGLGKQNGHKDRCSAVWGRRARELANRASEKHLAKGMSLFIAGENARGLFVVVRDAIRAFRGGGREQVILCHVGLPTRAMLSSGGRITAGRYSRSPAGRERRRAGELAHRLSRASVVADTDAGSHGNAGKLAGFSSKPRLRLDGANGIQPRALGRRTLVEFLGWWACPCLPKVRKYMKDW